ncbi:MAG TPA: hypothetical protein VNY33_07515 [Gaiellaceae bacterium]|jgi:hypothetical protein|nr:hypothetical protein [Gaiellaceae bacterium]
MEWLPSRPWTTSKALSALLSAALALAALCLILLVSMRPRSECTAAYQNPPTPLHSGVIALLVLVFAGISLFVGIGVKLGLERTSSDQAWATRVLVLATLAGLVAGGGVAADIARWTCFQ